jgi:hypothetical protein
MVGATTVGRGRGRCRGGGNVVLAGRAGRKGARRRRRPPAPSGVGAGWGAKRRRTGRWMRREVGGAQRGGQM